MERKLGEILFWMKLLVLFLALNLAVYGLQMAAHLSGCATSQTSQPHLTAVAASTSATEPVRTVRVLAVADSWYRAVHTDWQESIAKTVAEASALYQGEFGIVLRLVDVRPWQGPTPLTLPGQLTALENTYPATVEYDVITGFTTGSGLFIAGISAILGNHLVVADTPIHKTSALLAHEFGHVFGAEDTALISSAQFFFGPFSPPLFTEDFRRAIRQNKYRQFLASPGQL